MPASPWRSSTTTPPIPLGTVNWVEAGCAATCQMVFYLAGALGVALTPPLAECLLTGIVTDTLCFRTSNTTPPVLETAMHLQEASTDLAAIVQRTLTGIALQHAQAVGLRAAGRTPRRRRPLGSRATSFDQARPAKPNDESKLNTVFSTIIEADLSAVFTEKIGKSGRSAVECSFRAKPGFSVGELALSFGGGGHPQASGCTIEGELAHVVALVVPALQAARRRQASRANSVD